MSPQESCHNFMGSIKKLLKNYRSLLQNLREDAMFEEGAPDAELEH